MHINPEDAVQGFQDLKAKTLIPMHFGTFDLSDEPFGEPLRRLEACNPAGLRVLGVGENYFLPTINPKPVSIRMKKEAISAFHSN
jgi:L-ascorbate metabolism protein UlaG (beta-lactamase superfamily)